jgi:hypothetical protein
MFLDALLGAWRDRIQLWRSPGSRSAIERQESYLAGRNATDRRWQTHDTPEGPVTTRVATTEPARETVVPMPEPMLSEVREAAGLALRFVHDHVRGFDAPSWSLRDLDEAFAQWLANGDKAHCPPEVVEQIVASAFGEFCVRDLGMRWVLVTDAHGTAAAVEGDGGGERYKSLRSFPFAAVGKRIEAGESGFLAAICRTLQAGMAR